MLPSKDTSLKQIESRKMTSLLESGAPGGNRTPDPLLRRQTLYPTELRARSRGALILKHFQPFRKSNPFLSAITTLPFHCNLMHEQFLTERELSCPSIIAT